MNEYSNVRGSQCDELESRGGVVPEKYDGQIWRAFFHLSSVGQPLLIENIRVANFLAFQYQPGLRARNCGVKT